MLKNSERKKSVLVFTLFAKIFLCLFYSRSANNFSFYSFSQSQAHHCYLSSMHLSVYSDEACEREVDLSWHAKYSVGVVML